MKKIIFYIIITIFFTTCKKQEDNRCFKNLGAYTTITKTVNDFDTLEVFGKIFYELVQDSTNKIEITAGKNMLQFLTLENKNKKLVVHNKNMCNFLRSYKKNKITIRIHFKEIKNIIYSGALKLESIGFINQANLRIDCWSGNGEINIKTNNETLETYLHTGSADLHITGKSLTRYLYSANSSFSYDDNYNTNYYYVSHLGTGNYYIGKTVYADIQIKSIGDVYYKGNPTFTNLQIEGRGKLIENNE